MYKKTKTKKEKNNMKNVKTLLILLSISTFVFASATRTDALGGAGFWADDYANIGAFPASVNNHNVAWTDGTDFTSVWNNDGTTWGFTGGTGDEVANIMWGNGTMGVTFGLGMTAAVEEVTCADDAVDCTALIAEDAVTDIDIGFGMPLAGMDFGFHTNTTDHSVNLRRAQDIWVWDNMLVGVNIMSETDDGADDGYMAFNCDFYKNQTYASGTSGLFALGVGYNDMTEDGAFNLNWTFGVESAMTDWATLRVAYTHAYDLMNQAGADADGNAVVMGLGFNYGSFNLDMSLNSYDAMLNDPVKYVTGRNDAALGTNWTISYNW